MKRTLVSTAWLVALLSFGSLSCQPVKRPVAVAVSPPSSWPYRAEAAPVTAPRAMIVSEAPDATRVGVEILAEGGNAIDAAVAVSFALAVVYPEAGNLGGGGFAVVRTAAGEVTALDFREVAPAAATRDMYLDENGKPTKDSRVGPRASGVPGSVAGMAELHRKLGKLPWAALVTPSIQLALEGFVIDEGMAAALARVAPQLALHPASAATYLRDGKPVAAGTRLRFPELAETLRRIAERGPSGFYEGETAELIAAEMARTGGLITREDLRAYRAVWRTPIEWSYRGHRMWSMPPPSSGGITLALVSGILEGYDLRALGWGSWQHLHLLSEAMRRAFADRNSYLGDPDFTPIPRQLTDPAYAAARRATIDPQRATPSSTVSPGLSEPEHTTHFAVVDAEGNAVALTTTLNELWGSGVTITGAGFLMNNEMDDFTAKVGAPNMFGLIQGDANAILPAKRPLSAMSPTIVVDPKGELMMIAGGRGGPRIISATFQVMSNVIDFGMDAAHAVSVPRIHHQHLPDKIFAEGGGLSDEQQHGLRSRGHTIETLPRGQALAISPLILRAPGGGWTGAPDPRRGGLAAGL